MDRCLDAGAGPEYLLLFWGNITPLMVAAGGLGLVWAFAAAAGAYWPSAHLLAVVGAWGLFGGVSPADRYLVHPLAHAWVAYRIHRHKPGYHPWALVAVGASAVVSAGASIAVASSAARCDGWSTVVACAVAVGVGVAVDASLRWWKYLALVESAAITLVVAANPLECVSPVPPLLVGRLGLLVGRLGRCVCCSHGSLRVHHGPRHDTCSH